MKMEPFDDWTSVTEADFEDLVRTSREISWNNLGKKIQCYIPGRMRWMRKEGRYPTISITGGGCALRCDHCQAKLLESMIGATDPDALIDACKKASKRGDLGVLISGGCMKDGTLPWAPFLDAIEEVKNETGLKVTVHTGQIDLDMANALKNAGVDELLIDVIGSEDTLREVYHLEGGLDTMESSLDALASTGLPLIPHVVFGLHYGEVRGEMRALEMVAEHDPYATVIVVLIPIRGSPMEDVERPDPEDVTRFIGAARLRMPDVPLSLSCARPTGDYRDRLDRMAVEAGINRIAMPSPIALDRAREMGLEIEFHHTCCSKSY